MATAKQGRKQAKGRWGTALLALAALAGAGFWFFGEGISGQAQAATSYGAKYACACRYIGGREMNSCQSDFVPGMGMVFMSEDDEEQVVTAYVPLVSSESARFREGFGCVLDSWGD